MSGYKPFDPNSSGGGSFDPTTGINIERIFDGLSTAATQNPGGTGIANELQVEFGPAINTGSDPVSMDVNGTVTFNDAGTYRIKIALQFGRSGSVSESVLLFRVTDGSNVQLGRSIASKLDNANITAYLENDTWLTVPAAFVVKFQIMRDNNGNNSGGLIATIPDPEGAGTWNDAPTAAIRVERWV